MGSGRSGLYSGTHGSRLINGTSYNTAKSISVKNVTILQRMTAPHHLSMLGTPNSVTQVFRSGKIISERYYDTLGHAYLDIDYSDHGNPKLHPYVPHEHRIYLKAGKFFREAPPTGGINK